MNHQIKFHPHPVQPSDFKDATGALDTTAFRAAQEWERREMRLPAEVIARDLVASGQFKTTEEALAAIHAKRGIAPGRLARVLNRFLNREPDLVAKAQKAEAAFKEASRRLAQERAAAASLFSQRAHLRDELAAAKATVDRLELSLGGLAKRRADLFQKIRTRFTREVPFGHHSEIADLGIPVAYLDVAITAGNEVLTDAKRNLQAATEALSAFETKHAEDLAEVEAA